MSAEQHAQELLPHGRATWYGLETYCNSQLTLCTELFLSVKDEASVPVALNPLGMCITSTSMS